MNAIIRRSELTECDAGSDVINVDRWLLLVLAANSEDLSQIKALAGYACNEADACLCVLGYLRMWENTV